MTELEELCSDAQGSYAELAAALLELEQQDALQMVKSQGRNGKQPPLAYQYRINKGKLKRELHRLLQHARLELHPAIRLDAYYSLPMDVWKSDELAIRKVDAYLSQNGFPSDMVPAPERSFSIAGDEKWITEQGGLELLERIGLKEAMRMIPVADPLMLAYNPGNVAGDKHLHLIVENKTTYQGLLQALPESSFTTLIYGCGKKIIKSIEQLELQLPLPGAEHHFYYFGDMDHEGIRIWASLNKRVKSLYNREAQLALPFYRACLAKKHAYGKETQRQDEWSLAAFLGHFTNVERCMIKSCLEGGGYYPQEILQSAELKELWRTASWKI